MSSDNKISTKGSKNKYLTFFLGNEQYGIEISQVKEIIAVMKITHIPRTPSYVSGVINLRGTIIPVIDTRTRFSMDKKEYDEQTAIIIVEIKKISIGFAVDQVEEVLSIDEANLAEPPKFGTNIDTDFIKSMGRVGDEVIMNLDVEKLFEAEEIAILETMVKKD